MCLRGNKTESWVGADAAAWWSPEVIQFEAESLAATVMWLDLLRFFFKKKNFDENVKKKKFTLQIGIGASTNVEGDKFYSCQDYNFRMLQSEQYKNVKINRPTRVHLLVESRGRKINPGWKVQTHQPIKKKTKKHFNLTMLFFAWLTSYPSAQPRWSDLRSHPPEQHQNKGSRYFLIGERPVTSMGGAMRLTLRGAGVYDMTE